jgi:hypothetical protein
MNMNMNMNIMKQSDYIHFVEGFLLTPGYIDLSQLLFVATNSTSQSQEESSSSSTSSSSSQFYDNKNTSSSGTNFYMDGSALDIAVFHLVSWCNTYSIYAHVYIYI